MGEEDDPLDYSASEAFGVLADPTRLDILRALGATEAETRVPFSDLRERVGVEDSGRFTYHLETLQDTFVEGADGGYTLTYPGYTVYRLLVRGIFDSHPPFAADADDRTCPECGAALSVSHRGDAMVDVDCPDCGADYLHYDFPPRGVALRAEDPDALLTAVDAWVRNRLDMYDRRVCPWCAGTIEATLETDPGALPHDVAESPAYVRYRCGECRDGPSLSVAFAVLVHPAVAGFLHEHGVDPRAATAWELVEHCETTVQATDPPAAEVAVAAGDASLVLRVDEDADVVSVSRENASARS